jgi:hypothetical protein
MLRGKPPVNQYSEILVSISSRIGSSSDHSRNFSPIHASSASGFELSTNPIVLGLVACSIAYADPRVDHASALSTARFSNAEREDGLGLSDAGVESMFTIHLISPSSHRHPQTNMTSTYNASPHTPYNPSPTASLESSPHLLPAPNTSQNPN